MKKRTNCIFLVDDNIMYLNTGKTALQHRYTVITIPSGERLPKIRKKANCEICNKSVTARLSILMNKEDSRCSG